MKAKPTKHPGEVLLQVKRSDESLLDAANRMGAASPFQIKRILVPIDFSDCAKKALQYALPFAKEHGAALTLLYVVTNPPYALSEYGGLEYAHLLTDMEASGKKELSALATNEVRGEVPVDTIVRVGPPAVEIIEMAKGLAVDLIIISTHGRSGLSHVLLGSVAEHVIRSAPCPVLVVREREREFLPKKQ